MMRIIIHQTKFKLFVVAMLILLFAIATWMDSSAQAAQSSDAAKSEFFETKIRPVLAMACYDCHTDAAKSGLRVDSREALLKGGQRGAAIIIGKPEESLLIKAVNHSDENLKMPKGGARLKDSDIAALSQWITDGAFWPINTAVKNEYIIKPDHKNHWAFQPFSTPKIPTVKGKTNNFIDHFLLAKLEAKGLSFNPPADKRTLLRRATYDLTGLPPTFEEISAFIADNSPDAFATVIDRLLASPTYGEKWGRHWLDLARYSDTLGMIDAGRNLQGWFPYAYTYRDWVIRAFNEDLPYDQFILQQIAADKLPKNDPKNFAALGFLSLSRGGLNAGYHERIDDKIDVVSRGLLGLTVSCARCHNHKFDPIPTKDYYSFYSIFNNTREPKNLPLLALQNSDNDKWDAEIKAEEKKADEDVTKMREKRYPELKALYRSETEITKALQMAYAAREIKTDEALQKFTQEKDYNVYMLKRWRTYLQKNNTDEIWQAWQQFSAIPDKEFLAKSAAVIASLASSKINPLVAEALQKKAPASMQELAEIYGKLLATYDKPEPLKNPTEEQLRQVLYAAESPTMMPFSEYESFRLNTDGQNENQRRRKIQSLLLAQAYRGAPPRAQSLEDETEVKPGYVFLRGKPDNKGDQVHPQFLQILAGENRIPFSNGSGRLELAQSIADKNNPLTARVMVNRIWQNYFGNGLVRTPSDFGTRGDAPTHPELLDYLAVALRDGIADCGFGIAGCGVNKVDLKTRDSAGKPQSQIRNPQPWRIKALHRLILLSRAYQQTSSITPQSAIPNPHSIDPENKLLWHMNRRRLEIEELRDSLLVASQKLDQEMFGLPVSAQAWPYTYRRTIYSFIDRALVPNDFRVFDFADPNAHATGRGLTTGPQQALMMLNNPFVIEQAKMVMLRPEISTLKNPRQRMMKLYQILYGRAPNVEEISLGMKFIVSDGENVRTGDGEKIKDWQYGEGEYDEKSDRAKSFKLLEFFINGMWRNSPMPGDPRETTASLTSKGGSLGDSKEHSAIRRWMAPFDGKISINGWLEHSFENACRKCKGVQARIVSNVSGTTGKWEILQSKIETDLATIEVKRGDTLDFIAEAGKGTAGGEFKWNVTIRKIDAQDEWNSIRDFRQPSAGSLNVWDRYVQTLLATAEFLVLD